MGCLVGPLLGCVDGVTLGAQVGRPDGWVDGCPVG
jgi:hypothetical protein